LGTIVVSENISLDGVVQAPTGDEGCDRGGWFTRTAAEDREAGARVELQEVMGAAALLLYVVAQAASRLTGWRNGHHRSANS
jgi:hypothetical protein